MEEKSFKNYVSESLRSCCRNYCLKGCDAVQIGRFVTTVQKNDLLVLY